MIEFKELKGNLLHDFPYPLQRRKCPHYSLISLTASGSCLFSCPVCYARAYPWSIVDRVLIYKNTPEKLEAELKKARIVFPIYISQITDALQPIKELREVLKEVVKIILRYRLSFHIVTKSADGPLWLLKEIPELYEYPFWYISITVEATPEKQRVTSPKASPINDRLKTLKILHSQGVAITARTDPTIIGFIEPEELFSIIEKLKGCGVKHIVGSTGYFNKVSMQRFLRALNNSEWRDRVKTVAQNYRFDPSLIDRYPENKVFRIPYPERIRFHTLVKKEVERLGLTYAVCQELPAKYDSKGILYCEGVERNWVHIKRKGRFEPINCVGDCLRSCPNPENPPCGEPAFLYEYPYKPSRLEKLREIELSLCSGRKISTE